MNAEEMIFNTGLRCKCPPKPRKPLPSLKQKNLCMTVIEGAFKRKKSPFLMTFLFAPLFDERCSYNAMIEFVTISKLKG
jgi:hypothetical protein